MVEFSSDPSEQFEHTGSFRQQIDIFSHALILFSVSLRADEKEESAGLMAHLKLIL